MFNLIWWTFLDFTNVFGRFNINWLFCHFISNSFIYFYFHVAISPSYYHMGKADFLYFEVEAPKGPDQLNYV